jgi:multimeric flavodoxin WrbA
MEEKMNVLGVVASYRRQGNSEVFVKEALMGAEEAGAQVEILRLNNYQIKPCTGCGRCHTGLQPCHLDDDFNGLLDRMYQSDGIILGAPCYYLHAPAVLKLFLDRTVCEGYPSPLQGKPAAIIMTYGNRGFNAYAFTQPNVLLLKWGMNIIDRALLHSASPGDAMLDDAALARVREIGRNVVRAFNSGDTTYHGEEGICPVCHDRLLRILRDMKTVICPTCGIRGSVRLVDGRMAIEFTEEAIQDGRFSAEQWYQHHMYHVELGTEWFMATKELRKERRAKYTAYLRPAQPEKVS